MCEGSATDTTRQNDYSAVMQYFSTRHTVRCQDVCTVKQLCKHTAQHYYAAWCFFHAQFDFRRYIQHQLAANELLLWVRCIRHQYQHKRVPNSQYSIALCVIASAHTIGQSTAVVVLSTGARTCTMQPAVLSCWSNVTSDSSSLQTKLLLDESDRQCSAQKIANMQHRVPCVV
jgi:hypothetical protein